MSSSPSLPLESAVPLALSVEKACALSSLGRTKFYQLLKENKIVARKCGRRTIILKSDLESFLRSLPVIGEAS